MSGLIGVLLSLTIRFEVSKNLCTARQAMRKEDREREKERVYMCVCNLHSNVMLKLCMNSCMYVGQVYKKTYIYSICKNVSKTVITF